MKNIETEKKIVSLMIKYYCKIKHKRKMSDLCTICNELIEYSLKKLSLCRYGDNKPQCNKCSIHCYSADKRIQIKDVMKTVGPIMLIFHPIKTLRHFFK